MEFLYAVEIERFNFRLLTPTADTKDRCEPVS